MPTRNIGVSCIHTFLFFFRFFNSYIAYAVQCLDIPHLLQDHSLLFDTSVYYFPVATQTSSILFFLN